MTYPNKPTVGFGRLKPFLCFILMLALAGCMSPENPNSQKASEDGTGQVKKAANRTVDNPDKPGDENRLKNQAETSQTDKTVSIHIPAGYQNGQAAPAIFIFDPHGSGGLPVNKYSDLADEFGYVLVGSNQSRNNQPIEDGLKYYKNMKSIASGEISIDTNRLYTLGFSGGARVAVSIAIQEKEVGAVVGCGAGFPALRRMPDPDFYYFGMVGYEDFNMGELINNDRTLARSGFSNELVIFDGGHDWPPENVMREAFLALKIQELIKNKDSENKAIINKTINYYNALIDAYKLEGRYFDAAETAQRAVSVLEAVANTDNFSSQIGILKKNPGYREDLSEMVNTMERESGLQSTYVKAFNEKDSDWWKKEINRIKTPVDNVFEQRLNKRLEAFIGLMAYMMSGKAINENDLEKAQKTLDVYRMIEPMNPEHAYLGAVVMMKLGDEETAAAYLGQAIVLGFNNAERLRQEEAFKNFSRRDEFLEMFEDLP